MKRNHGRRPTVRDVARTAGVSVATVSRALSRPQDVKKETLERVLSVVKDTGYRSNQMAVQFRTGTSRSIMVLVSDITNAFYAEFFKGIEQAARSKGYVLLIGDTSEEAASERVYFDMLTSNKADGLLWNVDGIPAGFFQCEDRWPLLDIPLVACNGIDEMDVPTVRIDNDVGGRMAAEHLLELGHRRFAQICGPPHHDSIKRRFDGFNRALKRAGIEIPEELTIPIDLGIEQGRLVADRLLAVSDRPTAVFVHNDATAIGMLHTFLKRGLSVPGDFSIVGYDDMPYASAMTPELTTVRLPRRRWGAAACEMMISVIQGAELERREVTITPELKVRDSSGPPKA